VNIPAIACSDHMGIKLPKYFLYQGNRKLCFYLQKQPGIISFITILVLSQKQQLHHQQFLYLSLNFVPWISISLTIIERQSVMDLP
jgi:uncharacterized membrane protein